GVIELTVALHYVFDGLQDRIVWDVGHQSYPHKILTGRREQMLSLRKQGGIKAFPSRSESPYDVFGTGHSSTSVSAALGMVVARPDKHSVAVIGDGAMTAGMAYEAICHAGHLDANLLVILNDNGMSISPNEGGLANYLGRLWASKFYWSTRQTSLRLLSVIPFMMHLAKRLELAVKSFFVQSSTLFGGLGFAYTGPVDGHHVIALVRTLKTLSAQSGPRLLHIRTRKGAGLSVAENAPVTYHAITKLASDGVRSQKSAATKKTTPRYQDVFGRWICQRARSDPRLIAITPAMREGSGLSEFARDFPERYHDVAIAEQHAVTFAAGLACESDTKPVIAIYSTFLQRAYDQLIHDVSIQELDVLFCIDRAGLVGEDGPTHAGSYDLSYLRAIPGIVIAAPSDEAQMYELLDLCYEHPGVAAVRYPRGAVCADLPQSPDTVPASGSNSGSHSGSSGMGSARVLRYSQTPAHSVAFLAFGPLAHTAMEAAHQLDASVVDMRFVKPLDQHTLSQIAQSHKACVTLEENVLMGGAGSAVLEALNEAGIQAPLLRLGLPDRHIEQGTREQMLQVCGLDVETVLSQTRSFLLKIAD
ncbi:MAG: 1-deoxy-D-xylulose-5-phosphate synthase, partial [Gammaproteobacteria bacterium]